MSALIQRKLASPVPDWTQLSISRRWEGKAKDRAAFGICLGLQRPAVRLDDRAADR